MDMVWPGGKRSSICPTGFGFNGGEDRQLTTETPRFRLVVDWSNTYEALYATKSA